MAKDTPETHETVTSPENQQVQIRVDDAGATTHYSSLAHVTSSAEEIIVSFSQGLRPSGQQNVGLMKIDERVIMSPWAAKRLALALSQTVQRYEQTYGAIEVDPRKRMTLGAAGSTSTAR
ncbi:MAG: DUF3467 domain-containing protein [Planctomycetes bacterium]|nr:DUF3467 domain-containing protein [Planctomycetota bacterium]